MHHNEDCSDLYIEGDKASITQRNTGEPHLKEMGHSFDDHKVDSVARWFGRGVKEAIHIRLLWTDDPQ